MNDMNTPQEARLYDATAPMSDDGEERMTASENVLAWLLIEKIGVPDDVSYSPDQAQKIIAGQIDWAKELDRINDMLIEAQGDDEGSAIMPEFEKGWSVYAKVEACLHLLERRRDVIEGHSTITDRMIQRVRSAIDAALGERDVGIKPLEWQPIETADKNAPKLTLGIFRNGKLEEIHVGGYRFAVNDDDDSCWWSDQCDDEIVPTHWMRDLAPTAASTSAAEPVAWIARSRWERMTSAEPWLTNVVYSEDQSPSFPCIPLYATPQEPNQ